MWPISAMYKFRYLIWKFLKIKTIIILKYDRIKVKWDFYLYFQSDPQLTQNVTIKLNNIKLCKVINVLCLISY